MPDPTTFSFNVPDPSSSTGQASVIQQQEAQQREQQRQQHETMLREQQRQQEETLRELQRQQQQRQQLEVMLREQQHQQQEALRELQRQQQETLRELQRQQQEAINREQQRQQQEAINREQQRQQQETLREQQRQQLEALNELQRQQQESMLREQQRQQQEALRELQRQHRIETVPRSRGYNWTPEQIQGSLAIAESALEGILTQRHMTIARSLLSEWIGLLQGNGQDILASIGRDWRTPQASSRHPDRRTARDKALEAAARGDIVTVLSYVGREYRDMLDRFDGAQSIMTIRQGADPMFCDFVWGRTSLGDRFWRAGAPKHLVVRGTVLETLAKLP